MRSLKSYRKDDRVDYILKFPFFCLENLLLMSPNRIISGKGKSMIKSMITFINILAYFLILRYIVSILPKRLRNQGPQHIFITLLPLLHIQILNQQQLHHLQIEDNSFWIILILKLQYLIQLFIMINRPF